MSERDSGAQDADPSIAAANTTARKPMTLTEAVTRLTERVRPLFSPGQIIELRALQVETRYGRPYTAAGFFDAEHLSEMVRIALETTPKAKGVYYTLNPVQPDLLARRCNRIDRAEEGQLTKDTDILKRQWLLVDVDPVRDSFISASDAEKAAAWATIQEVRAYLESQRWPAPILADSGNGYHLLYRIDLPGAEGGVVERLLKSLAARFDNAHAKIDQTVFNPSRICKFPGTLARKGDHTPLRPHRRARLLEAPE